jgi:hypothetical protein
MPKANFLAKIIGKFVSFPTAKFIFSRWNFIRKKYFQHETAPINGNHKSYWE